MKRIFSLLSVGFGVAAIAGIAMGGTACSTGLSQPFANLKEQPITVYHLQNFDPQPAASPSAGPVPIPPQIQQWLGAGASLLPPGLLPPGLIPGAPAAPAAGAQRFYNFRILRSAAVPDKSTRDEILDIVGHESNFQMPRQSCVYAEFGISIGQPPAPGAPVGTPSSTPSADILVSLSCEQVQMNNYGWPYGAKTGLTADSTKRIIAVMRKAFGG